MAADWIKMRCELQTHPKVVRILSAMNTDKFRVIGGLHAVWCIFDAHSTDGSLRGYTPAAMDAAIGWPGFSQAMCDVGWLSFDAQAAVMPGFTDHNGQSAKRRADDQKRKRDIRKSSDDDADGKRTKSRLEKRRGDVKEKSSLPPLAADNPTPENPDPPPIRSPRGTRLPDGWSLTSELAGIGRAARANAKLPPVDLQLEADRFADFWRSKSGRDATKLDWTAAWRNWVRNAKGTTAQAGRLAVPASAQLDIACSDEDPT